MAINKNRANVAQHDLFSQYSMVFYKSDLTVSSSHDVIRNFMLKYISPTDMRIVASMASMLEEPYWKIEEPNPLMFERSEAKKFQDVGQKELTSMSGTTKP